MSSRKDKLSDSEICFSDYIDGRKKLLQHWMAETVYLRDNLGIKKLAMKYCAVLSINLQTLQLITLRFVDFFLWLFYDAIRLQFIQRKSSLKE
jgi:hypothetical protein